MHKVEGLHLSLDEAREELKKRWNNVELRKKIEEELGENFMPQFKDRPRGVSFRQVCSPDNGFALFYQMAKYTGVEPLVLEYYNDIFVHLNEEKKGMGRLRVNLDDGKKATVDVMNFHDNEKRLLGNVVLKSDEKLIDFHRNLFKISGYPIEIFDNSKWFNKFGHAADYYYPYLLHAVSHGIIFDNFEALNDDKSGIKFLDEIIIPAIEKIEKLFNLKPLIVRLYPNPENQTAEEDFYWWSYPPNINEHIVNYAKNNNLKFKIIK